MNRPELFQKSVDTLLDAYNQQELRHHNCYACAVGNLLSDIAKEKGICISDWAEVFVFYTNRKEQIKKSLEESVVRWGDDKRWQNGMNLINSSGYTVEELMKIEYAFETADDEEEEQYKGLCAVLEALKEIHEKDDITVERKKLDTIYEMGRVCTPAMVS